MLLPVAGGARNFGGTGNNDCAMPGGSKPSPYPVTKPDLS